MVKQFFPHTRLTKPALAVLVLAMGAYAIGYKSHDYVHDKILPSIRDSFSSPVRQEQYKHVECPRNALEIAIFGQSNSANTVSPLASIDIPKNLFQYDWKSKKCFEYKEPLLGTNGTGGNVITYAANELARKTSKSVIIIPFGLGQTSVLGWAYGNQSYRHDMALSSMKESGLSPKVFLWHQGESDARVDGTSPELLRMVDYPSSLELGLNQKAYSSALQVVLDRTFKYFPESKFGIALASRCTGRNQWEPVREAQKEIANTNKKSFISADSDKIYDDVTRYDKCHFSAHGAAQLGRQYYLSLASLFR